MDRRIRLARRRHGRGAPDIKGAIGENLRKALDWLPTGRRLVTVRTDCDLSAQVPGWPGLDALALREVDRQGLLDFFVRYGFRTWRKELESLPAPPRRRRRRRRAGRGPAAGAAARVRDRAQTGRASNIGCSTSAAAELVALDTETDSLDGMRAQIVGISFATQPGIAAYVPLRHDYPGAPEQLPRDEVLARLTPWLQDARRAKVGQNIKYDLHVLCQPRHCRPGLPPRHHAAELRARSAQAARPGKPGRAPPATARA